MGEALVVKTLLRHLLDAFFVEALERVDIRAGHAGQLFAAALQRGGRAVNGVVVDGALQPADGLQNRTRLASAARAQLGHHQARRQAQGDGLGVGAQQALIGAGEPVLGQQGNHVEERAAHLVIQILRGQLFGKPAQPLAHVERKLLDGADRGSSKPQAGNCEELG